VADVKAHVSPELSPVRTVHIVASCTQGKRCTVPPELRLGDISEGTLAQRLVMWSDRLHESEAERIAAVDLYRGQHWAVVRELPDVAKAEGHQANLWVASAGYGLVPAEARVRPYSATFAASEEDSVWRPGDGDRRMALRTWWNGLQAVSGPDAAAPRSISALAGSDDKAVLLVIASPSYVAAMAEDLESAREQLVDPQHLIIVSSRNGSLPAWLTSHLVPSEAPLSRVLGGALGSLHARTARRILQESAEEPLRADVLVSYYERLISEVESATIPTRVKLRDEDVRRFIREVTAGHRGLTCTAALRKLRATGRACEQRRFVGLYAQVTRRANVA
jgi:hypothetical protein